MVVYWCDRQSEVNYNDNYFGSFICTEYMVGVKNHIKWHMFPQFGFVGSIFISIHNVNNFFLLAKMISSKINGITEI